MKLEAEKHPKDFTEVYKPFFGHRAHSDRWLFLLFCLKWEGEVEKSRK